LNIFFNILINYIESILPGKHLFPSKGKFLETNKRTQMTLHFERKMLFIINEFPNLLFIIYFIFSKYINNNNNNNNNNNKILNIYISSLLSNIYRNLNSIKINLNYSNNNYIK